MAASALARRPVSTMPEEESELSRGLVLMAVGMR